MYAFPLEKREENNMRQSGKIKLVSNDPTNPSSQRAEWYQHFQAADMRRDMFQRKVTAT